MLIVTLSFKFQESWYIVNQQCQFSARAAILAMMEPCLEVGDLLQEFLHVLGVPEETSAWIFYGEEDSMLMAKSAQLLSPRTSGWQLELALASPGEDLEARLDAGRLATLADCTGISA